VIIPYFKLKIPNFKNISLLNVKETKMPYRLIKGTFALYYQGQRHVGSRPDGDSAWFKPDQPQLLDNLGGRNPDFNGGDFVQLRFEGIDALELHYPGSDHHHKEAAVAARDFLLQKIGFTDVEYAPNPDIPSYVRSSVPTSARGYILTRNIDPYGRPVAFVFAGAASETDGTNVFLSVNRLDQSVNAMLMKAGQVYPAYYGARENIGGLPWDLRNRLTELADNAWELDKGLWAVDVSMSYTRIRNKSELMELAIWPKLYRRLAKYFNDGNTDLRDFESWLREPNSERDDNLWIIPRAEEGNLHDIFNVRGNRISMLFEPEDLIIMPR
jgi:endonuclease YncB( thermonuclease family)